MRKSRILMDAAFLYKENHSLNEWFHEAYGGEPEIQVPEKRKKQIEVCSWRKKSLPLHKGALRSWRIVLTR